MAKHIGQVEINALDLLPKLDVSLKVRNVLLYRLRLMVGLFLMRLAGRCLGGIDRLTVDGKET
jgi:hypothetical protein